MGARLAVLFLISAQIQESKISSAAERQLSGARLHAHVSPNTILVLGSDARTKGTKEAGAQVIGQASRTDSILLMRVGGGKNATLSIPRDTVVDIPGHGRNKINAAYAIGGPSLAIKTVESYLGIDVNHLVEVNFENFPQLIDSLGGITYKGGCVVSNINGGKRNGGVTLRLKAGDARDQRQAGPRPRPHTQERVRQARGRPHPRPPPAEDPLLDQGQGHLVRDVRPPAVGVMGRAEGRPQSDMAGPSLLGLVGAEMIGGGSTARVLKPSGGITLPDGGAGLVVDDAEKQAGVERFLKG